MLKRQSRRSKNTKPEIDKEIENLITNGKRNENIDMQEKIRITK